VQPGSDSAVGREVNFSKSCWRAIRANPGRQSLPAGIQVRRPVRRSRASLRYRTLIRDFGGMNLLTSSINLGNSSPRSRRLESSLADIRTSRLPAEIVRITDQPSSEVVPPSRTGFSSNVLKAAHAACNTARRCSSESDCFALAGLGPSWRTKYPGRRLAAIAAALCPGLICPAPFGAIPTSIAPGNRRWVNKSGPPIGQLPAVTIHRPLSSLGCA
jgi:hypothetical protein